LVQDHGDVSDELLGGSRLAQLHAARLNYAEAGATRRELPAGYRHLRRQVTVGAGSARFEDASRVLLNWDMQRRSGLRVQPSSRGVEEDSVALMRLGIGIAAIEAPVRVVYVVDEPRRRGFAYGTLQGHPERGEEAFVVEHRGDDTVVFTLTAFSRPAWWIVRVAGPIVRGVQGLITNRYVRSLQA
jgi:uncharacterized protein (UPF0548 family)